VEDYQANSKKVKGEVEKKAAKPEKKIEKVTVGQVIVKKKSLGQKIKDVFIEADFRSVTRYVVSEVMIPAARNMIVDASTKGVERMMYGDRAYQRRGPGMGQPRITYNSPVNRGEYRNPLTRPPSQSGLSHPRAGRNDFILTSREEAFQVLESMNDIIEMYEAVSVADLNELVGFPSSYVDQKWGWTYLGNAQVRPVRDGFMIDLPPAESI
jgi:hypothetical protein